MKNKWSWRMPYITEDMQAHIQWILKRTKFTNQKDKK